jgi:hypothetical protein
MQKPLHQRLQERAVEQLLDRFVPKGEPARHLVRKVLIGSRWAPPQLSVQEAQARVSAWVKALDAMEANGDRKLAPARNPWKPRRPPWDLKLTRCPFSSAHRGPNFGSPYAAGPMPRNDFHGEFRCKDPACAGRGYDDLLHWTAAWPKARETAAAALARAGSNRSAP